MGLYPDHFILVEKEPVAVDWRTWAEWFEKHDRTLAKTEIGVQLVSTVFLGLNHQFDPSGPPLLFETMIFNGPLDQACWRYSTWAEAEEGHLIAIAQAMEHEPVHINLDDIVLILQEV